MTNPPDAMREQIARILARQYGDIEREWETFLIQAEEIRVGIAALSAAKTDRDGAEDTARLDWLDQVNTRTNDRVGTNYGWKFDINHNRAALTDHNLPAMHVRAAIDEARLKSAPAKQEGKMG
jgi:hypothetical protein